MKSAKFPPCAVCSEPLMFIFALRLVEPCKHVAHQWCKEDKCVFCYRPPRWYDKILARVLTYTWYGMMGDAHAMLGEYRRSVMMATTLMFYWAIGLLVKFILKGLGPVLRFVRIPVPTYDNALYFIIFVWWYERLLGTAVSSCLALWISGEYGMDWAHPAGHAVDMSLCVVTTYAFSWWDLTGALTVFMITFHKVWSWPRIWDIHPGNCCGAGSVAFAVGVTGVVAGTFTGALTRETFKWTAPIHAVFVTRVLFDKQTTDPFSAGVALCVRQVYWVLFIVFLVLGHHSYERW